MRLMVGHAKAKGRGRAEMGIPILPSDRRVDLDKVAVGAIVVLDDNGAYLPWVGRVVEGGYVVPDASATMLAWSARAKRSPVA